MVIKVIYKLDENKKIKWLSVKGHSGYDEKGKDLICSAVSSVVNGGINFLHENFNNQVKINYSSSLVDITTIKTDSHYEMCLRLLLYQLQNISNFYSKYVTVNLKN